MSQPEPPQRHLFISPHLDDAVWSAGALIADLTRGGAFADVLTVFAGGPDTGPCSDASRWLADTSGLDADSTGVRRREDQAASGRLGARVIHVDFPTALERKDATGKPRYAQLRDIFSADPDRESDTFAAILAALRKRLRPDAYRAIYLPLGVGRHIDHLLVRKAVEELAAEVAAAAGPVPVYYEDWPYVGQTDEPDWQTNLTHGLQARRRPIGPESWAAKVAASATYRSQLKLFWATPAGMEAELRAYARGVGGNREAERFWLLERDAGRLPELGGESAAAMTLLLTQNAPYVPALHGAAKGNRLLLEALVARGHTCLVVAPSAQVRGLREDPRLRRLLGQLEGEATRHAESQPVPGHDAEVFHHRGVEVHAVAETVWLRAYLARRIREANPDWILVSSEDPGQLLLEAALEAAPGRVVYLARTPPLLPFGPASMYPAPARTDLFRQAAGVIAVSDFLRDYIRQGTGRDAVVLPLPEYGPGPFPHLGDFARGFVTLVNPCAAKGMSIFLELARALPEVPFAAVPTWGTTAADRTALQALPNVTLLDPQEDINGIFRQTRVLLVPSLWAEGRALIIAEAMLRGIPVLASDIGGMREAKLGLDYVLPARPIERYEERWDDQGNPSVVPVVPAQDVGPWLKALQELLGDRGRYERLSAASRAAALDYLSTLTITSLEDFLRGLAQAPQAAPEDQTRPAERPVANPLQKTLAGLSPERRALLALRLRKKGSVALASPEKALTSQEPDRPALPTAGGQRRAAGSSHVPAEDPLQATLVQVWEELLGVRPVGIRDDFFQLGGHAVLAARMAALVEERCGHKLPLSALFNGATIEHLARVLQDQHGGGRELPTVLVQGAGRERCFVYLHGDLAGGGVYCYRLGPLLGADQPFLAVHPHGLASPQVPGSIEEMAADYLHHLLPGQPEGPCLLGGYSAGAVVAYEMARQLHQRGRQVELVVVFAPPMLARAECASAARPPSPVDLTGLRGKELLVALFEAHRQAAARYVLRPYPGRVALIQSEEDANTRPVCEAWRAVAGELEHHRIPGNHYSALREHIEGLAAMLRILLRPAADKLKRPDGPTRSS